MKDSARGWTVDELASKCGADVLLLRRVIRLPLSESDVLTTNVRSSVEIPERSRLDQRACRSHISSFESDYLLHNIQL